MFECVLPVGLPIKELHTFRYKAGLLTGTVDATCRAVIPAKSTSTQLSSVSVPNYDAESYVGVSRWHLELFIAVFSE
jgi:hypothetical protein